MKQLIKSALRGCGLEVRRAQRPSNGSEAPKEVVITIGGKTIYTDCAPLAESYQNYPETNRASTRVIQVIKESHKDFQAVDIGANCGDTIAFLFDGWSGNVLAVEPDEQCQKWLKRNWGQDARVKIKQKWLGSAPSVMKVNASKTGWNTSLESSSSAGSLQIELTTLDEVLLGDPEFNNVKFIKVDTEGYDGQILLGSRQTLLKYKPVVLFESNMDCPAMKGTDPMAPFTFMMELGYETFLMHDAFGRFVAAVDGSRPDFLRDLLDYADGKFGKVYYFDAIAIHKTDAAVKDKFLQVERQHRKSP
jgi:FkbM family methyltransferase